MATPPRQHLKRAQTALSLGAHLAFRRSVIGPRLALMLGGALVEDGWFRSFRDYRAVDRDGRPVPWYTYSFRAFLEPRLSKDMRVFEYGAGLSSIWYAERVGQVVSVEHQRSWADRVRTDAPANLDIRLEVDEDAYVEAIRDHSPFDIVVVDGQHRARATEVAVDSGLCETGVMIWDNSDWPDFERTFPGLQARGFKRIGFRGMGPISRERWETSVLYRPGNCLGI